MPYMTTHSVTSFGHDAIYDNDGILERVPNLLKQQLKQQAHLVRDKIMYMQSI